MTVLECMPKPCISCPYRRDCPSGVWAREEYDKLRRYDGTFETATFHCHQENRTGVETVCRGWLTVHAHSTAVNLAVACGKVTMEQVLADPMVELYGSGTEAADAGEAQLASPNVSAVAMIERLTSTGTAVGYEHDPYADPAENPCKNVDSGCLAPAGMRLPNGEIVEGTVEADGECSMCGEPLCSSCADDEGRCYECTDEEED